MPGYLSDLKVRSSGTFDTPGSQANDLSSDQSWSGQTRNMTAGENLSFGDLTYIKSDGKRWKADADADASMILPAFCVEAGNAEATLEFLYWGWIRDDTAFSGLSIGRVYGSVTAGAVSGSAPGSGKHLNVVAYCEDAGSVLFLAERVVIEQS